MFLSPEVQPMGGGSDLPPPRANEYARKKSMGENSVNFIYNMYQLRRKPFSMIKKRMVPELPLSQNERIFFSNS